MQFVEFKQKGGDWLGKVRSWIRWNCKNGSDVTWGSDDVLNRLGREFTVKDIEEIAAEAAFAAVEEYKAGEERKKSLRNSQAIEVAMLTQIRDRE